MIFAALALSAALSDPVGWINWKPQGDQVGVVVGDSNEGRLILWIPPQGCSGGMKVYSGKYGDFDKAVALLKTSHICRALDAK